MQEDRSQRTQQSMGQQDVAPPALDKRSYSSLWLACSDPIMDRALCLTQGLSSALIFRPLRPPTPGRSLIEDLGLDMIESAVRHRHIVQIVVCGHAVCSSTSESHVQGKPDHKSSYEELLLRTCRREEANRRGQSQVLQHIRELEQSQCLSSAVSGRVLTIHGLFYHAESGVFSVFNHQRGQFVSAAF